MSFSNTVKTGFSSSLVVSLAVAISGCSGGGSSTGDSFTKIGRLDLDKSSSSIFIDAIFFSVNPGISINTLRGFRLPGQDNCEVDSFDGTLLVGTPPPNPDDYVIAPLSAGEVLTLTSDAGSYVDLINSPDSFEGGYDTPIGQLLDEEFPAGLKLNIPGDEFPALTAVTIPDVQTPEITSPASLDDITPDTQFEWVATNDPNALLSINVEFDDMSIYCSVVDDGEFVFPAEVKAVLETGAVLGSFRYINRNVITTVSNGGSVLIITSTSSTF